MRARLRELWRYRGLVRNLVARDLKARYRSSVLGIIWSLLNPLLMMVVFTVVFTVFGRSEIRAFPAFILCALLPWNFFTASLVGGMASIVGNGGLVKKVYFPREALPIAVVLANLANYLLALPVFFVLARLLGVPLSGELISPWIVMLPLVIVVQAMFSLGVAFVLATVNVYYRDIGLIMEPLMTAWFFLTPVFWDVSSLPASYELLGLALPLRRLTYILNPMASIIASYRDILYYGGQPGPDFFVRTVLTALLVLVAGYAIFQRFSPAFGEEV
jgi:ABC-type polysaccharide/polyol phosphate export permease